MFGMVKRAAASRGTRSVYWLGAGGAAPQHSVDRLQQSIFNSAVGAAGTASGFAHFGADGQTRGARLGTDLRASDLSVGDVCGSGAIPGHLLSGGELDRGGANDGAGQGCGELEAKSVD